MVALSLPLVETVSVLKALDVLLSVIAPPVEDTCSALAVIAPLWPMAPPEVSVKVPPTLAEATVTAEVES